MVEFDILKTVLEPNPYGPSFFGTEWTFTIHRTGDLFWPRYYSFDFDSNEKIGPTPKALRQRRARYRRTHHKRMASVLLDIQRQPQKQYFREHVLSELVYRPGVGLEFQEAQSRWVNLVQDSSVYHS